MRPGAADCGAVAGRVRHRGETPDFTRLAAWDALRARFLDLPEDTLDRSGKGFRHNG
ncbi:hypothetical protein ACH4U5_14880 [Streptomyces sp. NPDC020858]|uniref:hypothetical protein n=1 Tax=Streptomyces sp. NPDC020858 TaxID=3365097 RepID=UPI0037B5B3D5